MLNLAKKPTEAGKNVPAMCSIPPEFRVRKDFSDLDFHNLDHLVSVDYFLYPNDSDVFLF